MRATVYVVVTYHRYGDEIHAFGARGEAEACVMEYAREFWNERGLGRFPRSYTRLYDAWGEHDLWGSIESRWELEQREVELPEQPVQR